MSVVTLVPEPVMQTRNRVLDYVMLTKPRVAVLVLFTVGTGAFLAGGSGISPLLVFHAVLGTALVAGGASALNQLIERHSDGRMRRTRTRPLPGGRLHPREVLVFGLFLGLAGITYLLLTLSSPTSAILAALTFILYVGVYTPLKPLTPLNTLIGAIPGAMPPVIGWAAVRGDLSNEAWILFAIVFLWQIPHFLAIAWMYREEYDRAGLLMLPVLDPTGERTSLRMITYCLSLIPVSLAPVGLGYAGLPYLLGAILLGVGFLVASIGFWWVRSESQARQVFRVSLLYLPLLLGLLMADQSLTRLLVPR